MLFRSVLTERSQIDLRWQRHHASVLSAVVADSPADQCPPVSPVATSHLTLPSLDDVAAELAKVRGAKGLGPDGISADLLRAGGWPVQAHLHAIICVSLKAEN